MPPQTISLLAELVKLAAALVTLLVSILAICKIRQVAPASGTTPFKKKSKIDTRTVGVIPSTLICVY